MAKDFRDRGCHVFIQTERAKTCHVLAMEQSTLKYGQKLILSSYIFSKDKCNSSLFRLLFVFPIIMEILGKILSARPNFRILTKLPETSCSLKSWKLPTYYLNTKAYRTELVLLTVYFWYWFPNNFVIICTTVYHSWPFSLLIQNLTLW